MIKNKKIKKSINFLGILFILGGITFSIVISVKKDSTLLYKYNVKKSSNYFVLLKPNNFYASETLPPNHYYASNSINSFKINLQYAFDNSKKTFIKYYYNISCKIIGSVTDENKGDETIWFQNKTLQNNVYKSIKSKNFYVNKDIVIDYNYYNDLARKFEKTYNIKINSSLKIYFTIYYDLYEKDLKKKIKDTIELEIPLTNTVTYVKENYKKNKNYRVYTSKKQNNLYYDILVLIIATGFILIISANFKIVVKNKYQKYIKYIFRNFSDLIITVLEEPDISGLKIIRLYIIDDLIDVAEQKNANIIYYEVFPNELSNFYVITDNYVYIFTMTSEQFRK